MKYKKDIETLNFFCEKNAKSLSSSPSYWRFNKVEWIYQIVNENKEKKLFEKLNEPIKITEEQINILKEREQVENNFKF